VPVTKVPYGTRETVISRDRWLVVVMVVVDARYEYVLSVQEYARYLYWLICNT
jgi:hypothetical protein